MSIPREHQWSSSRRTARIELKRWRQQLSPADHRTLSEQIGHHLRTCLIACMDNLPVSATPSILAVYWPIQREPDLRDSFDDWRSFGFELALPVTPAQPGPLQFARWIPGMPMTKDAVGITVPASIEPVSPQVILVPCLGFTTQGYRLGYGGGYYDRTLPQCNSVNLGVAYQACELTRFATGAHDRALDQVVTEQGPVLAP